MTPSPVNCKPSFENFRVHLARLAPFGLSDAVSNTYRRRPGHPPAMVFGPWLSPSCTQCIFEVCTYAV